MTTLETLKAARKLIELPAHWIQRNLHVGGCYCASGAICAVASNDGVIKEAHHAISDVVGNYGICGVWRYNDTHTHPEVLRAFDEAIAKLEAA